MQSAKHAYRGTMKALQDLGLDKNIKTVDDVAKEISDKRKENINEHPFIQSPVQRTDTEVIYSINPDKICNWQFSDRTEFELGNIEELAHELRTVGQQQPCIVRPYKEKDALYEYEIIAGERRWRAAKLAKLPLKVIIKDLDDYVAALCQASENQNRENLSDYAKGMSYAKLIEKNILTQKDLESKLGVNKVYVTRLLSFYHVPKEIWDAIGDPTKISARTSAEIRSLCSKNDTYKEIIISLAPRLKTGKLGAKKLVSEINKILNKQISNAHYKEVKDDTGRHLFSWRGDSNGNISISFPKDIRQLINKKVLENTLKNIIAKQLLEFPRGNSLNKNKFRRNNK